MIITTKVSLGLFDNYLQDRCHNHDGTDYPRPELQPTGKSSRATFVVKLACKNKVYLLANRFGDQWMTERLHQPFISSHTVQRCISNLPRVYQCIPRVATCWTARNNPQGRRRRNIHTGIKGLKEFIAEVVFTICATLNGSVTVPIL